MKHIEIDFSEYSTPGAGEAYILYEFHDKDVKKIRKEANDYKKEYEEASGLTCEEGDYSYAEGVDLIDILPETLYNSIYEACMEEADVDVDVEDEDTATKFYITTDLATLLYRFDSTDD